ncbi:MAG: TPM domain-containing protein [Deltaproteobacteria bacterium]|nr:TPM domain-containing protein [Deltaproteobacteria bacterium]
MPIRKLKAVFLFTVVLFMWSAQPLEGKEANIFPRPQGAVNDFAGIISPEYRRSIDLLAREILQKTKTSVIVATVETIGDNDPADYVNRLYEAWGIGAKGEDRGVLIFLALKERRIRIETGYGVEGILPDGLVGQILDSYVVPYLKQEKYGEGLYNGVAAVSAVIAREAGVALSGQPTVPQTRKSRGSPGMNLFSLILFIIIISMLLGTRSGRAMLPYLLLMLMMGGRGGGGGGFGGFGGGFGGFGGGMSGGGGAGRGF